MLAIEKTIAEFVTGVHFSCVRPDDPVSTAVAQMLEHKLDCVVVTEDDRPVGIFTEHDFLNRIAAAARDPERTKVREVMTPNPEVLHPHDRMQFAINRMAVGRFRNIPIVDVDNRLVSVLDVRMVMLHLLKLFADVEREGAPAKGVEEWTDIGGG